MIESERAETDTDRDLITSLVNVMVELDFYKDVFEAEFSRETQQWYRAIAQKAFQELNVSKTQS